MLKRSLAALVIGFAAIAPASPTLAAETFKIDKPHAFVLYKIAHFGWSNNFGRFNDVSGSFTVDEANPGNSKVEVVIKADSVDSGHEARDKHLKSADFFNAKEFPEIKFVSTKIEKTGDRTGKMTGNLTLLGVTKPVTFDFVWNKKTPHFRNKNQIHTGFSAVVNLKRSDWGMKKFLPAIGDDVTLFLEIEGVYTK